MSEIEARGEATVLLSLATAVEEAWLKSCFPGTTAMRTGVSYDESAQRVVVRRERRFRDLVLEAKPRPTFRRRVKPRRCSRTKCWPAGLSSPNGPRLWSSGSCG